MATQIDCGQCVARRSRMVARSVGQLEWKNFQNRAKTYDSTHNRCTGPLLGRDYKPQRPGVLGQRNKYFFIKCKGVISSVTYFKKFVAFSKTEVCANSIRFSHSVCNDKLSRGCRSDTRHFSKEHLGTSLQEQYNNSGQTFSWQAESRSGQIKQVTCPIRMAHASKTILQHRQNVWSPQYRSFCVYPNQTITQIQQFVLGSGDRRGGRVKPMQLVYRSKFCQSALQNVTSSYKPHLPNKSRGYHYCASLASPDLGKAVTQDISASTPEAPETKTNVYTMPRLDPRTNEKQQVVPLCLESEWEKHLTKLHWPQTSIVAYKYFLSQSTVQQVFRVLSKILL